MLQGLPEHRDRLWIVGLFHELRELFDESRGEFRLVSLVDEFLEPGQDGQRFLVDLCLRRLPSELSVEDVANVIETVVAFEEVEFIGVLHMNSSFNVQTPLQVILLE